MRELREALEKIGLPGREVMELPTSKKRFSDGAQYRLEVPGIQSPEALKGLLEGAREYGVTINRITETRGIMRLTDREIKEMCSMAKDAGAELVLSTGPRATYDISAQAKKDNAEAGRVGYRLRGAEQLVRALADIKRACDLGCRAVLVYDEGFLWALDKMRKEGAVPHDLTIKLSAHCGHGNPASVKLLQDIGANSVNVVRDLAIEMLASIRSVVDIPIDIHIDNPASTGGFIRTYDAPEFVRVGSPVYLKCGASVFGTHAWQTTERDARMCAKQASLVQAMIERFYPEAVQTKPGSKELAIPV